MTQQNSRNRMRRPRFPFVAAAASLLLLSAAGAGMARLAAQELKAVRSAGAAGSADHSQNWTSFFGNEMAQSYSPLAQITRDNVKQLAPAWTFPLALHGLESAPLVVDGALYLEAPNNDVYALDAVTGKQLWKYTYSKSAAEGAATREGGKGRGLASGFGMVFMGTNDNHVVAIDMKTGSEAVERRSRKSQKVRLRHQLRAASS